MRATTSGVTHNIFFGNSLVQQFLKNEANTFKSFVDKNNVIYDSETIISDSSLNYLNVIPSNYLQTPLKNLIVTEFEECEKIYPYLGEYFLHKLFKQKVPIRNDYKYCKKKQKSFVQSLKMPITRNLAEWFFDNASLKRSINVEKYSGNQVCVEYFNDLSFNFSFDYDFFKNRLNTSFKNYRYIIVDGIVETVGEIHHMLYQASLNKEPYVLFCFGVSEEVKQTIIKNNAMNKFRIYPVCLDSSDENTLNVLNDIAAIHGSDVITSAMGQTISQEVRKKLKVGKHISFRPGKIILKPCVEKIEIELHREFIKKRIQDAKLKSDVKIEPLQQRLKNLTAERVNIYLPEMMTRDKKSLRELDYFFRFLSNTNKNQTLVKTPDNQIFYIPSDYINIANAKIKSLTEKLDSFEVLIIKN